MKSTSKFMIMAAAVAATLGLASFAEAAPSIQLTAVYRGSTAANTASAITDFGTVTNQDLTANSVQATPNLKAVFDIYAVYDGGTATGTDAFQGLTFNIVTTGGITGASSHNDLNFPAVGTAKKYYSQNTGGELSTNTDGGTGSGDLQSITLLDGLNDGSAFAFNFGTTSDQNAVFTAPLGVKVGHFAIAFTNGALSAPATISFQLGTGASFAFFDDPNNPASTSSNVNMTSNVITIPAAAVPEPASLGVLALGGIALLARRRKTA